MDDAMYVRNVEWLEGWLKKTHLTFGWGTIPEATD